MWETIAVIAVIAFVVVFGAWRFYLVASGKASGGCCGGGGGPCAPGETEPDEKTRKDANT